MFPRAFRCDSFAGLGQFPESLALCAFRAIRSLDNTKIITIKKINQAFFYVFFRFFVFSLISAGLRASFSPFVFFVFPIVKAQKKPVFFRFCPIPPISPQKKDFLYIYLFSCVYILLFIGGIGEIGKKSKISAALRRFCYWGKIGTKGKSPRFPRLSLRCPIRLRCFHLCGAILTACVFCQACPMGVYVVAISILSSIHGRRAEGGGRV